MTLAAICIRLTIGLAIVISVGFALIAAAIDFGRGEL